MNQDDDYEAWLNERRAVQVPTGLADRILTAIDEPVEHVPVAGRVKPPASLLRRAGPVLLWTAASLFFMARVVALVGNLVYPSGYPEFAVDERIEEVPHEHGNVSRS